MKVSSTGKETVVSADPLVISALKARISPLLGGQAIGECLKFDAQQASKDAFSPEIHRICNFLNSAIPVTASDADLLKEPSLHLGAFATAANCTAIPATFGPCGTVKRPIACLLREIFALNTEKKAKHDGTMRAESAVDILYLPVPVPVIFDPPDDSDVAIRVAVLPGMDRETVFGLVNQAIRVTMAKPLIKATYVDVDVEGFESDLQADLEKRCDFYFVKDDKEISGNRRSFDIYAIPKTGAVTEKQKDELEKVFHRLELRMCTGCGEMFSDTTVSEVCIERQPDRHELKQIPFDDGQLEHLSDEVQGILVRYECCGVVVKGSPGCVEVVKGPVHVLESETKSKFDITVTTGVQL